MNKIKNYFKNTVVATLLKYSEWLKFFRDMVQAFLWAVFGLTAGVLFFPCVPFLMLISVHRNRKQVDQSAVDAWWDMRINFFLPWSKKFFLYRLGTTTFDGDITPPSL